MCSRSASLRMPPIQSPCKHRPSWRPTCLYYLPLRPIVPLVDPTSRDADLLATHCLIRSFDARDMRHVHRSELRMELGG